MANDPGPSGTTPSAGAPGVATSAQVLKWSLGLGGTWLVLTILVDVGDTQEVAVAFALVLMGSVLLQMGPQALKNLGFIQ